MTVANDGRKNREESWLGPRPGWFCGAPFALRNRRLPRFKKLRLTDKFYAEGAYYADFNKDGKLDVVAGPLLVRRPRLPEEARDSSAHRRSIRKNYSDNFLTFTGDFNGDGWPDVLYVPDARRRRLLVREPGRQGGALEAAPGPEGRGQRIAHVDRRQRRRPARADLQHDRLPGLRQLRPGQARRAVDLSRRSRPRATISASPTASAWATSTATAASTSWKPTAGGSSRPGEAGQALDLASLPVRRRRRPDVRLRRRRRRTQRRDYGLALPRSTAWCGTSRSATARARSPGSST